MNPNGHFMRIRMRIRCCGSGLDCCYGSFFVELYSGALVHWLRIHLCGSASGTMKNKIFFKMLINLNSRGRIRCCGSVLIMFF
jgi:hypothetical protein